MKALAYRLGTSKEIIASYLPDFEARSIADIDFELLKKLGIKHLLFDLDQTLRRPYSRRLEKDIVTLLNEVNASRHFKTLNLVSNNQRRLHRYSKPINANVYQPFRQGWRLIRKPNPLFFQTVLANLKAMPSETVMIGDRLHADVLGGNRMGMYTIYVAKRGPIDYWFDWLLLTRRRDNRRLKDALARERNHKTKK